MYQGKIEYNFTRKASGLMGTNSNLAAESVNLMYIFYWCTAETIHLATPVGKIQYKHFLTLATISSIKKKQNATGTENTEHSIP